VAFENQSRALDQKAAALNREWFSVQSKAQFVSGSPHLNHVELRNYFYTLAREVLQKASNHPQPPTVFDMGAGDGALTVPYLELGARVTAADVTVEFLESLKTKSAAYRDCLTIIPGDIFETLRTLEASGQKFDLVCASSFLHHIPDYVELCRLASRLIRKGGLFFTFQDPLRYDTLARRARVMERIGYFWWRMFQGNYVRGLNTRLRRLFGVYRPNLAEDTAEFHVVRQGVDQIALKRLFESEGFECEIHPYWSTHSRLFQRWGKRLGIVSYFAFVAARKP
jgi:2-polyprenyl-3-methyl-5-hydroxy-6-metoxy-1,4-benzoquinol methylase